MNNWGLAIVVRERLCPRHKQLPAVSLPMLLLLCGLFVCPQPVRSQVSPYYFSLNPIPSNPTNVTAGTQLGLTISSSRTINLPPGFGVVFFPPPPPPTNWPGDATITSDGHFSWTPDATLAGTSTNFRVWAYETYRMTSNFVDFTVSVLTNGAPVATPPDLVLPLTQTNITVGMTLTFTAYATNRDGTTNPLTFDLDARARNWGASIVATTGLFTWTPTNGQTGLHEMQVIVTEAKTSPILSTTQAFTVNVLLTNNCPQYAEFLAAVAGGGLVMLTNCPTIVLSNTLTISNSVTLDAGPNNVTITGNNLFRLFTVLPGIPNFTLRGFTLSGGQDTNGGAVYIGSGAVVVLSNCTLAGNGAVGPGGFSGNDGNSSANFFGQNGGNGTAGSQALGGAIYNLGALTALNSRFLTNRAVGGSGGSGGKGGDGRIKGGNGGKGRVGALGYGGAIYNLGAVWLTNCAFSGNAAIGGDGGEGGASGSGAFLGKTGRGAAGAAGSGGALYSAQSITAVNCTFAGNAAQSGNSTAGGTESSMPNGANGPRGPDSLGGGIYLQGDGQFYNCTFFSNSVAGGNGGNGGDANPTGGYIGGSGGSGGNGSGGGIYSTGTVTVVNCTFSSCGALGGTNGIAGSGPFTRSHGATGHGRGGNIAHGSGTFVLRNSILADSFAGNNAYDTKKSRITDGGYNLSSDTSLNLSGTSYENTDPMIGSLTNNGGPTLTIALQTNSPAIDAVPPGLTPATDQRGVPRPQGAASDIGAYEFVTRPLILVQPESQTIPSGSSATFTVSALGDDLRYQWRFNSAAIANATAASYIIARAVQTNDGTYDVLITNGYGAVLSAPATLNVLPFTMTGRVLAAGGTNGLPGVQVSVLVSSNVVATKLTLDDGGFTFTNLYYDAYTIEPARPGYSFVPTNRSLTLSANTTGLVFTAFPSLDVALVTNGTVQLTFAPAFTCKLLASTDLSLTPSSDWEPVFAITNLSTKTLVLQFADTNATESTMPFYRLTETFTNAPNFTAYTISNQSVSLDCVAAPVSGCLVEASSNGTNWNTVLRTNFGPDPPAAAPVQFRYVDTANLPARYYRLSQTPGF